MKNKKSFTLIEVLISMLLFSFVLLGSIQSYRYLLNAHKMNELRYLALAKLDSEMNRLAFAYENLPESDFTRNNNDTTNTLTWQEHYNIHLNNYGNTREKIYKSNPLKNAYNLELSRAGTVIITNYIKLNNNTIGLKKGDIVARMAWKIEHNSSATYPFVYVSLNLTYPYVITYKIFGVIFTKNINSMPVETLNLKTALGYRP